MPYITATENLNRILKINEQSEHIERLSKALQEAILEVKEHGFFPDVYNDWENLIREIEIEQN